jgi:hypothetical protein
MNLLGVAFSIALLIVLIVLLVIEYSKTREFLTPWMLFLVLSLIDVFAPAILYLSFDFSEHTYWAPYIPYFNSEEFLTSLIVFFFAMAFFALGYFCVSGLAKNRISGALSNRSRMEYWQLRIRRIYAVMLFSGAFYIASIIVSVYTSGSLSLYLAEKYQRIYGAKVMYDSALKALLFLFAPSMLMLLLMLVGVLFYYREKCNRKILWGFVFPFMGWLFTLTTFFRGSQLIFFLMLVIIETFRLKEKKRVHGCVDRSAIHEAKPDLIKKVLIISLLAGILFSGYGAIRNYFSAAEHDIDLNPLESILLEAKRFMHGEGLIGLTWILQSFPEQSKHLGGKTFIDMLLLPVPRLIYPSKPEWYGIADITRSMGGPESTQDAVTMPGELYANFGYLGIPLMSVFGVLFGLFHRYRYDARFRFIYAALMPPVMLTTFWMSFTGFVNGILSMPFMLFALIFVIRKRPLQSNIA